VAQIAVMVSSVLRSVEIVPKMIPINLPTPAAKVIGLKSEW
jgi:hypothetical protein